MYILYNNTISIQNVYFIQKYKNILYKMYIYTIIQLAYTVNIYIYTHIHTNISSSCYNLLILISQFDKNILDNLLDKDMKH